MLTYKYDINHWSLKVMLVYYIISIMVFLFQLFEGLDLIISDSILTANFMNIIIFTFIFIPLISMIFISIICIRFLVGIKTGYATLYEDRFEYTDKYRNVVIEYSKINYVKLYYSHAIYIISNDSNKFHVRADLFEKKDFFVEFEKRANAPIKEITIFGFEKKNK